MSGDAKTDEKPGVLLLRDVPEQGLRSMERLADAVEHGFARHARYLLSSTTLHQSRIAARAGLGRIDGYLARFLRYPLAARARRADLYHVVDHGYAHVAALLPRDRLVVSCHDLMLLKAAAGEAGFRPGALSLARFRWSVSYLRRAARIVCPTEATKRDVARFLEVAPSRIDVVPYAVAPSFRPLPTEQRASLRRALAGHARVLLHVSTGDPYKNVEGTLATLADLLRTGAAVRLVRAGAPLTPPQRALARRLGVGRAVIDCGRVDERRLVELYNAADALLFPSHAEGFGWPPLEAMACATPVVASDCDALVETCGGAALHAPARDPAALACAVGRVLARSDLAEDLRWRGVSHAACFTEQRMVDGFARAYDGVLGAAQRTQEDAGCAA